MKKLTVALIGAGGRGRVYTNEMLKMPEKYQVIAVAEPVDERREYAKEKHGIADNMCFTNWDDFFKLGKVADMAVIATMDKDHFVPVMKAIELGYDILLEKPVSPDPAECKKMAMAAKEKGVKILVCHVLRYAPLYITMKKAIDDGLIGDIVSVNAEECVGNVHQSHSFVRGNWGNSVKSSPMLLQKCCHDLDILQWLIGKKLKKIQSFGTLTYFKEKNAPEGSPEYCYQGCPVADTCPYNAVKIYLDEESEYKDEWYRRHASGIPNPTSEHLEHIVKNTQYGKCVFKCDNDVVDHQTLNALYEDDITLTFTMTAFNKGGRTTHIFGTKGELNANWNKIEVYDFETKETREIPIIIPNPDEFGHGGGDYGIVCALYDYIMGTYTGNAASDIGISVENHIAVFAAEKSRLEGTIVDIDEYIESL